MDQDDINSIIDGAKPAERTTPLCLRGDLVGQFEALEQKRADAASRVGTDSLSGTGGDALAIAQQMEDLRLQMQGSMVDFTLRAMPRKEFRKFCELHPPRKDDDGNVLADDRLGVNQKTVWEPLIRKCLVAPELDPARLTRVLDEILSDKQFEELAETAWAVNRLDVDIPFSAAASRLLRASAPE